MGVRRSQEPLYFEKVFFFFQEKTVYRFVLEMDFMLLLDYNGKLWILEGKVLSIYICSVQCKFS